MESQKDFKELLELLNKHKVQYVIVGAYALAFYGAVRTTGDMDILINPSVANAKRVVKVLEEFGFGSLGLKTKDFTTEAMVVQLGFQPTRIDILTSITGVSWSQINKNKATGKYGDTKVFFISKKDLITNKKILGRHKDLADIESIQRKK